MEVREGYKQTYVGVIPNEWDLISFGKAFDFLSTASYSRTQLVDDGEVNYVHYGDIHTKWSHFLDFEQNDLPSIKKEKVKGYHLLKEGDLIMADASEDYDGIGKSVEVKNIGSCKAISGLHTFLLRDSKGYFVNGFKAYIHANKFVKKQFDKLATGLKVYGVSKNNLRLIEIPLPPTREEQTAISTALSDMDKLIQSLEKLITKKRNIKQGAMQELLTGEKRLPGFSVEWEEKKLGKICEKITTGKLDANAMNVNGEYRFYTCAKEYCWIDEYAFDTEALLVSGNGANVGYIHHYKGKFNAYQRTYVLYGFGEDVLYIKVFMERNLKERIRTEVNAGNTPYITMGTLADMIIKIPPTKAEQNQIATTLNDMESEIKALEVNLNKCKMIKQGMMQNLLTGRIRLI